MQYKYLFALITFCAGALKTVAQTSATDSLKSDSMQVAEISLLQLQEQHLLDSLVKISLQQELKAVAGDTKKTKELEDRLRQIGATDSMRNIEQLRRINELKKISKGYPVAPFGDTLFYVYAWIGPYKAQERAASITQRIRQLYADDFLKSDSLKTIKNDNSTDIFYKNDFPVTSVTNIDALWLNTTSDKLAKKYLQKIKTAIQQEKANNSFVNWLKKIGLVLLIILGVAIFIFLLNKLFRVLKKILFRKTITIQNIKLLSGWQYKKFVSSTLNIFRIVFIILIIYLSLPLLFTVFPETKNLTNTLLG